MRLPSHLYEEIRRHALGDVPRECCGLIAVDEAGDAAAVWLAANVAPDATKNFLVDPEEQRWLTGEIERAGLTLGAIYHSHPRSDAELSEEDVRLAYPDVVHLVMGMSQGLVTRAWRVNGEGVTEEPIELFPGERPEPEPRVIPWAEAAGLDRVAPRECVRAARDALDRAYGSVNDAPYALMMEALDWQRRALEQMVP